MSAVPAYAVPVLQLDIAGGHYDSSTQTIVAGSNPFTLSAIYTPAPWNSPNAVSLFETFYISAAVSPQLAPPGAGLGSFTFGGQTVDVTNDMTYGTPPVEYFGTTQGSDPGDLPPHGIYPTYFSEFAFNFSPTQRADTYNTADNPGGLVPNANGGSYYTSFTVDTRLLDPRYVIHFDLYDETVHRCGRPALALDPTCQDNDVNAFAPFSHDAESSPPVPEPASLLLLGAGLGTATIKKYRQRNTS
jgi:hypothetical protein